MAGQSWSDGDPFPYASADAVRFGLGGLRYLYQGHLLTGPHIGYPLVLIVLALNTLLLWLARGWGARAERMLRVSAVTLALTLGLGWPTLLVAQQAENQFMKQGDLISVRASPLNLYTQRCTTRPTNAACQAWDTLNLLNPTAWGLLGLALTGAAGLRRSKAVPFSQKLTLES